MNIKSMMSKNGMQSVIYAFLIINIAKKKLNEGIFIKEDMFHLVKGIGLSEDCMNLSPYFNYQNMIYAIDKGKVGSSSMRNKVNDIIQDDVNIICNRWEKMSNQYINQQIANMRNK